MGLTAKMRLREARQIRVANALLHFCILLFLAQILTKAIAIMEHPELPGERSKRTPPSIWNPPILRFIKTASTVFSLHIQQGFWDAYSPKPTQLLTTIPDTAASVLECPEGLKVRTDLPPPLLWRRPPRPPTAQPS